MTATMEVVGQWTTKVCIFIYVDSQAPLISEVLVKAIKLKLLKGDLRISAFGSSPATSQMDLYEVNIKTAAGKVRPVSKRETVSEEPQ